MEKICPVCTGKMKKVASGMELPSLPFLKIPQWIKEAHAYECETCGYIGLWHEQKEIEETDKGQSTS